jgi:hypothetical protein
MDLRSVAYSPTLAPGMGGMMPGMHDMQGMPDMTHGMYGVPGHLDFDPCCPPPCPPPCPPYTAPVMQQHCPIPTPVPTPTHEVYVVKSGDSVWKIANRYGTTMRAIILANDLRNPDLIYPGQILIIPGASMSQY